jgi:hypothetical protein
MSEYKVLEGFAGLGPPSIKEIKEQVAGFGLTLSGLRPALAAYRFIKGQLTKPKVEKTARYKGEDAWGFGIHSNGTIDCINVPLCEKWTVGTERSMRKLWELESTYQERLAEDNRFGDGLRAMMRRLLVTVVVQNVSHYSLTNLPTTHVVIVSGGPGSGISISDGINGMLVLRHSIDRESTKEARRGAIAREDPSSTTDAEETLSEYDNRARVTERWVNEHWEE